MRTRILAATLVLGFGTAVYAADEIKIELKDFTVKSAFEKSGELVGHNTDDAKLFFYTNGTATAEVTVPADGEYTLTLNMSCDEAKSIKAQVKVSFGDDVVKDKFDLTDAAAKDYTFTAKLKKGKTKLAVAYLNDEYKESEFDRNFYLHAAKLEPKK